MTHRHTIGMRDPHTLCQLEHLEPRLLMSGSLTITDTIGDPADKAVSFGDTVLGASSSVATFSLANTGDQAVNVTNFAVPALGSDFDVIVLDNALQAVTGSSFGIAAGETYTVQVAFNPVGTVGDKSAAVTFSSDDPGNASVSLAASGKALTLGAGDSVHVIEVARPLINSTQYVTYDLVFSSATDWTLTELWMTLNQGSIYQNTTAGTTRAFPSLRDTPPLADDLLVDPNIQWDTYFSRPDGASPEFFTPDSSYKITATTAHVLWYDMEPIGAFSDAHLARITVTADAVGTLNGLWSNDANVGVGANFYSAIPLADNPVIVVEGDFGGRSLTFPNVILGGQGWTKTFTIANAGVNTLNIVSLVKDTSGNPGDFTVVVKNNLGEIVASHMVTQPPPNPQAETWTFDVEAGQANSYTVEVTFTPQARGARGGSITLHTNDNNNETVTLTFSGVGVAPGLTVTDSSGLATDETIDFADTVVGRTSSVSTFTLASTDSSQDLSVTNFAKGGSGNPDDFTVTVRDNTDNVVSGDSFVIPHGVSYTVEVAFAPAAVGDRTGSIIFNTDDPSNAAVLLSLTGTGNKGALVQVTDTNAPTTDLAINFPHILIGATSTVSKFTLANIGDQGLEITDFAKALAGNPGDFSITVKDDSGAVVGGNSFTVPAGENYKVEVTFSPTGVGARNATIVFDTNDVAHGSIILNLTGIGDQGAALAVTDDSGTATDRAVSFADTAIGATSTVSIFTLSNTGDRPLSVTNFAKTINLMSGDFSFVVKNNTGTVVTGNSFAIPAGEEFTVEVTFTPSEVGPRTGSITFNTNDVAHASVTLNLSGLGDEGSAGHFGTVGIARNVKLALTDADGTLVTFSLSGLGSGEVIKTLDGWDVVYTGTDAKSAAKITTKNSKLPGDDGRVSIDSVTVQGAMKSLAAATTDLTGDFTVDDSLAKLTLGNAADGVFDIGARLAGDLKTTLAVTMGQVTDVSFTSLTPMASLAVTNWLDTGLADVVTAPSLGKLTAKTNKKIVIPGDFQADLYLYGLGVPAGKATLGSATIDGTLSDALWDIAGSAGNITVRGDAADSTLRTSGNMGGLKFGSLDTVNILAGIDGSVLDYATQAGDFTAGVAIKSVTAGAWADSHVSAAIIGSVKVTNGSFTPAQTMIHVLNNAATPTIAPIKTISVVGSPVWKFNIGPQPTVLEIL